MSEAIANMNNKNKRFFKGFVLILFTVGLLHGCSIWFQGYVVRIQYSSEAIPCIGHISTQVDLYHYEHDRLPFDDDEIGMVTTWRRANTKRGYEPIQYCCGKYSCGELVTNVFNPTNTCLFRMEMPLSDLERRNTTADQFQIACLATGGTSNNGTTNGYAYAVGCFGNGRSHRLRTGVASLNAYFPNVVVSDHGFSFSGYRLVVPWENYYGRGSIENSQIRFGFEPEPGVCMLIPPEAFKPGAVTKLRGDGPDSVEYWVERLRADNYIKIY